jgi:hypothetical protein
MANQEKSKHLLLKKAFKQQEKEKFVASLPMQVNDFLELFEDLDNKLVNTSCNHTLANTQNFLNKHRLPVQVVVSWLNEHGGYCDCEVLANVEEKFENL